MQLVEVLVGDVDQVLVDGHGNVDVPERHGDGTVVIAHACLEDVLLHLGDIHRRKRVFVRLERPVVCLPGSFANVAILTVEQRQEVAVRDLNVFAVLALDGGELEVGVVERIEHAAGGAKGRTGQSQHRFDFGRTDMLGLALQVGEALAVDRKLGELLDPGLEASRLDAQEVSPEPGSSGAVVRGDATRTGEKPLVVRVGGVGVVVRRSVEHHLVEGDVDLFLRLETGEQQLAGARHATLVGLDEARDETLHLGESRFPIGFGCENHGQIPGHFDRNLVTSGKTVGLVCHVDDILSVGVTTYKVLWV